MSIENILKVDAPRLYDSDGNEVGLREVCRWWINSYPEDIFIKEPADIVQARKCMQRLLDKMQKKKEDKSQKKLE